MSALTDFMKIFNIEFWVVIQMVIDLVLVVLILYFLRNLKSGIPGNASKQAAGKIIGMLEPLLKDADSTAKAFETQLKEKNRLIHNLNERLDSRIISLNLLLNRTEAYLSARSKSNPKGRGHVYDQQKAIIELFNKGHDVEAVARKLSMPKGEVELVVDLKKKFLKMEQALPLSGK